MTHFETLFRLKYISRIDWQTAKFYQKLRYMVLRSMAMKDALHESSTKRILNVKGMTHDNLSSKTLEQFWIQLNAYFKSDPIPVIMILDSLTGFYYPTLSLSQEMVKKILKKLRNLLKYIDTINLFQEIENDFNLSRLIG